MKQEICTQCQEIHYVVVEINEEGDCRIAIATVMLSHPVPSLSVSEARQASQSCECVSV